MQWHRQPTKNSSAPWARLLATALLFGLAQPPAPAAGPAENPPPAALSAPERERHVADWVGYFRSELFKLDAAESFDLPVREHAQKLTDEWIAHLGRHIDGWLRRPAEAGDNTSPSARTSLGVMQAWARFQLAQHEAATAPGWVAALAVPTLCDDQGGSRWLQRHLRMLQSLPAENRAAAFAADWRALQRMSDPAWLPPPRPSPSLLEALTSWVDTQRAGRGSKETLGMTPRQAWIVFTRLDRSEAWHWADRCDAARWWAAESLRSGVFGPADAVLAFRYAALLSPSDVFASPSGPADENYPTLARRWAVTGDVTVAFRRDALGRVVEPRVVGRQVRVPGAAWPDGLPWDTVFDTTVLGRAQALPAKPGAGTVSAAERVRFEFKLE